MLPQRRRQRLAVDELHGVEVVSILFAEMEDVGYVRMPERCGRAGLWAARRRGPKSLLYDA